MAFINYIEGLQSSNELALTTLRLVCYQLKKDNIAKALQTAEEALVQMEEVQSLLGKEG